MEIDLTDVERLAWEGLMREQQEAQSLVSEITSMIRTDGGRHPRGCALLHEFAADIRPLHTARAQDLSRAISKAHAVDEPKIAPQYLPPADGKPGRLTWAVEEPAGSPLSPNP